MKSYGRQTATRRGRMYVKSHSGWFAAPQTHELCGQSPSPEAAEAPGLVGAFVFPVIKIIRPFKRWKSIYSTPILKITQRSLNKHFLSAEKVQNEDKEEGEKVSCSEKVPNSGEHLTN